MKIDQKKTINPHFLQGEAWAGFQHVRGKETFYVEGDGWSARAILESPSGLAGKSHRRLYVPYGPTCKGEQALIDALKALKKLGKEQRVSYVRVEPCLASESDGSQIDFSRFGLHLNPRAFQPEQTLVLSLETDEETLLMGMSSTNRNLWRTRQNKKLECKITYDPGGLRPFLDMLHETAERTGITTHADDYFASMAESLFPGKHAGLAYVYHEGEPIVGAIFFDDHAAGIRYYAHAGSFVSARQLQANSPLLSYLIFDSKEQGMKQFDFYGVAPLDATPEHHWYGHSRFKRSFGGEDKFYSGTWELPVKPILYSAARLTRKLASLT